MRPKSLGLSQGFFSILCLLDHTSWKLASVSMLVSVVQSVQATKELVQLPQTVVYFPKCHNPGTTTVSAQTSMWVQVS